VFQQQLERKEQELSLTCPIVIYRIKIKIFQKKQKLLKMRGQFALAHFLFVAQGFNGIHLSGFIRRIESA